MTDTFDIAIIGGGIVGLATAMALSENQHRSIVVLEAEDDIATHQSGHNSGVIHSGLYYTPGSLKAQLCVTGREDLYQFCETHDIAHERCGKVIVATTDEEAARLEGLRARGEANGLAGLKILSPDEVREHEPHVTCRGGLLVPDTGIVDFAAVCRAFAEVLTSRGAVIRLSSPVSSASQDGTRITINTTSGSLRSKLLINCAGLQADRVARKCGYRPAVRIIPFRGEFDELVPEARHLVRNLIYPVPDPRVPFLGVHFTRMIHGGIEAGPNAVMSFNRHGYRRWSFSARDTLGTLIYPGFWKLAARHWRTALQEWHCSISRRASWERLRRLIPDLREDHVRRGRTGVRAMAVDHNGMLVDDFRIARDNRIIHVLNTPSPAATASIAIGRHIARFAGGDTPESH